MSVNLDVGPFGFHTKTPKRILVLWVIGFFLLIGFGWVAITVVISLIHQSNFDNRFRIAAKARTRIQYKVASSVPDKNGGYHSIQLQPINGGPKQSFVPCIKGQGDLKAEERITLEYREDVKDSDRIDQIDRWECYVILHVEE